MAATPQVPQTCERPAPAAAPEAIAPRPVTLAQTGLSIEFLGDLISKHLATSGVLGIGTLVERLALAGPIVDQVLHFLRQEGRVEVRGRTAHDAELRYGLTERGRTDALDALLRGGYVGAAPVPLATYRRIVAAQSVHQRRITRARMRERFADVVLPDDLLDQLGAALNSGRAIFVHGLPGTGKSFVTQQLHRALDSTVLVPRAVLVNDAVVEVYDPQSHRESARAPVASPLRLAQGFDPRFVCCEPPVVITGGELTLDLLELRFQPETRTHVAPLQMKANNGVFVIDDLGRQQVRPEAIFNRWIVPMEDRRDHLSLASGQHFTVPFDVVLVFSTNLRPHDVADDAFLRRIGYKIGFRPVPEPQYRLIWRAQCARLGLGDDAGLLDFVVRELHGRHGVPLLPCHPRDLLGMALDRRAYEGAAGDPTPDDLRWAWRNYFLDSATPQ